VIQRRKELKRRWKFIPRLGDGSDRVCLTGDNSWEDVPLKKGTKCYNSRQAGQCDGVDVFADDCIVPVSGAIYPAYYIASVIYVPPGAGSSVDYGQGSVIGNS
jgi:hypothetical protein